jgi:hypothetical protein
MTAEPIIAGREHWTSKGDVRLFLWTVMPGVAYASLQQKNYRIVHHILHSFFSQPGPVHRGH